MKSQLAMVIDSSKCIDCKACMVSCKVANEVPEGQWRNWIKQDMPDLMASRPGRAHFQPGGCMHCDNPTCVAACPTGATFKSDKDGTVVIDQDLCIGCGNCIPACPYAARYRHPEKKKAEKCDFCTERRARGQVPACVDTCPTKARVFGDINAHELAGQGSDADFHADADCGGRPGREGCGGDVGARCSGHARTAAPGIGRLRAQ